MKRLHPSIRKSLAAFTALTTLAVLPLTGASVVTNWVAYNDHNSGAGTAANVTTYSLTQSGNVGQPVGGPLLDFSSGTSLAGGMQVTSDGHINGTTGSSTAPTAGTPVDQIFGGKIEWASSALYFGPSPYTAQVVITFTNLTPGARYNFRGTAVRGNNYTGRWSLATLTGASSSTPAHIPGTPTTPGIVTNGWSPYGDTLQPNLQAAWNSGDNRVGDVIAWDDIVPIGNSFSVVVSNYLAAVPPSSAVPNGTMENTYCYAFAATMLEEVMEMGPVELTQQPVASTNVEAYAGFSLAVKASGGLPSYQWYKGDLGAGVLIAGANSATYAVSSAALADAGNYYVVVTNELNSVTSTVAQVTVFVNPLAITQQPTNALTVVQLRPFNLSVAATGTRPYYQWYKDEGAGFAPLPDATNSSYSVASADATNAGSYQVVITNLSYSVTSSVSVVTVSSDGTPPTLVRVTGSANLGQVTVEFNEALSPEMGDVGGSAYFTFTPDLYINSVTLTNDRTVVLFTDPQPPGQTYSLLAYGKDLIGNFTPIPLEATYTSWVANVSGGVIFDVYPAGTGTAVSNLTSYAGFPNSPSLSYILTNFTTTNLWPDVGPDNTTATRQNYGGRLRGFFIPPVSGDWRFFLWTDDGSELWLNPGGPSADGKVLIASEPGCCNPFQEPSTNNNLTSAPFPLIAGRPYYLEALYKEQGGGDFCQVAARREGDPTAATNLVPIVDIGYANVPAGLFGTASVSQQPTDQIVESPGGFTLSVLGSNSLNAPFNYQWQQNDGAGTFTNMAGATLNWISKSNLMVADSGMQFRCIIASGDSSVTSQVAAITVLQDSTGPTLLTAIRDASGTNILLTFSEVVLEASATNAGHYAVCDVFLPSQCVTVLNAIWTNNGFGVLLETEPPDAAGVYAISVNNVTDTNANTVVSPARATVGLTASFQQGINGYVGTVDTHVRQDNATTAYAANAVVLADNASPISHGLIRFDNIFGSGAGLVLPGATIMSAKLILRTDNWGNDIRVHRMLVPWEATNTWNTLGSPNDGVSTNAGGDAVTSPELVFQPGSANNVTGEKREIDVTASVRFWSTNTGANFGWALIDTGNDGYQFNSSEATTVDYRPQLLITFAPQTSITPLQIVAEPEPSQTINEGQSASFTVTVTGTRPEPQWYKDGIAIPDATNLTYTLTGAVETNSGRYYCIITNLTPSQTNSADAFLVVNPDTNAPALVSALGTTNASQVRIVFNEPMSEASVTNIANYVVSPAFGGANLAILSAELNTNGTTVIVTTAPRDQFAYYQLTVQNVTDAAYRHNVMTPNPTKLLLGSQIGLIAAENDWRYNQDGLDLGTAWTAADFVDTAWSNGPALFVGKNGTPGNGDLPIRTSLSLSNTSSGTLINTITYYFRQNFTMPSQAQLANLRSYQFQVRPILDDGAVFHINGQEARRVRMTNEVVGFDSYAQAPAQGNDYRFEGPYSLPETNVVFGGINTLAVEVHQINAGSSDVAFAAEVLINVPAIEMRVAPALVTGTTLQLTWPPVVGYRLYEADRVEGPYSPVPGNPNGTYSVSTTLATGKFYQLRSP